MFEEVKEKLKSMGYEINLAGKNDIVVELLKETNDKVILLIEY